MRKIIILLILASYSGFGFVQIKNSDSHLSAIENNSSFLSKLKTSLILSQQFVDEDFERPDSVFSILLAKWEQHADNIVTFDDFLPQDTTEECEVYLYPLYSADKQEYFDEIQQKRTNDRNRRLRRQAAAATRYADNLPAAAPNFASVSETEGLIILPSDSIRILVSEMITFAKSFIGLRYRFGGSSPRGFDCSGFMQYVFNQHGMAIPRTSHGQSKTGTLVSFSNAKKGDLIFFGRMRNGSYSTRHVGMVIETFDGGLRMIHSSRRGIIIDTLMENDKSNYYVKTLLFIKRVLTPENTAVAEM